MGESETLLNQGLVVILKRKNTDRQPIIHTLGNISGILGYADNEMKEESFSFFDIVAEIDRERVRNAIHMHLENGSTQFTHAPYHINKANGNKIIVNDSTLFQKDEKGRVTHIVSYIIDISGAKPIDPSHDASDKSTYFNANVQPEDDILKVNRRNNALLDALPDMMFLLSEDGRIVNYKSDDTAGLYKKPHDFLERHVKDVLPEHVANLTMDKIRQVQKTGEMKTYVYQLTINGKERSFESRMIQSGKGEFLTIVRDITESKEAEERINYYSDLQEILMNMSTRYINIPTEDVDQAINQALREMGELVRADRSYVFDYNFEKQVCNNTYEWCRTGIEPQIENLQEVPLEMLPYWVDTHVKGETMYVKDVLALPNDGLRQILEPQDIKSLITVPMMYDNECIGFIGFDSVRQHHDYSEREKMLLEVFAQLVVNLQMRAKAEKELIRAKEKAEESDRLKSAFLTNMSHEFRTPMNGILGFTELLKEGGLDKALRNEFIQSIEQSGQRMLSTVNDLIDISMIESGQAKVEYSEVDINQLIESHYSLFYREAEEKSIKLSRKTSLPSSEAVIYTDKAKLTSILSNLIKNAVKYTNSGWVDFGYARKNDMLEFYISDTGIGIPDDRQHAVFERFVQADVSDTRAFQGSGLGLSISWEYVEMLGGKIWVESEEGKGSNFFFTIPYRQKDTARVEAEDPSNANSGEDLKNLKIIIAEDDESAQSFLKAILKKRSREIYFTVTGQETVDMCYKHPDTDVILMDMKMPEMNGYEATRRIREFNRDVTIIAQTAYALKGDKNKTLDAGCDDYIAKPIKKQKLLNIISQNIKGNSK